LRFTVLASGSAGNASLVEAEGFGVLIDVGLGPRQLGQRLTAVGASWRQVDAAVLTHTHGDHWNEGAFAQLHRHRAPLYCHPEQQARLVLASPAFVALRDAGLVRPYAVGEELALGPLRCCPLPLSHDGAVTCGFRIEAAGDLFGPSSVLGYAADLGTWDAVLADALADVDVLALEFNHEVALQRASGRSPRLILRNLGDRGHLSNAQAALFVHEVLRRSPPGRLRHLVQLHLSRDCNRPELAVAAAQKALTGVEPAVQIHTACQHEAGPSLSVGDGATPATRTRRPRRPRKPTARATHLTQLWLPGWDE
jgi:phosphoribosyl 1,2-cyclic phosphodiesterase